MKELNLFKFVFMFLGAIALVVSDYLFTGTGNVDVVNLHDAPPSSEIYLFFLRWAEPLILGSVGGMFFLFGGGIMLAQELTERRNQYLREQGIAIKTEFGRRTKPIAQDQQQAALSGGNGVAKPIDIANPYIPQRLSDV